MKRVEKHGILGWAATAVVVIAYDYWAMNSHHQTMSNAFKNGLFRRSTFFPTLVGWAILTWHLFHPPSLRKTDLFSLILDRKIVE
jgi:hypothetical protein